MVWQMKYLLNKLCKNIVKVYFQDHFKFKIFNQILNIDALRKNRESNYSRKKVSYFYKKRSIRIIICNKLL
jgi:hypothetical protein